jgi:hypothetical protein
MHADAQLRLRMANERIARDHRYAADERLAEMARRRHRPSLRRQVGRSIIRIGERLASEKAFEPARAR